ncbi:IF2P factor, partial [Centropus bengalensis]|nr:IF2P factor [Centropus bengalensis]
SAKDDIDIDALAAEIEGAGAAKEQEPQKSKGKKKKEKKKQDFDEDDILKELEELSIEAQGGKIDREPPAAKQVENDNEESLSKQDKKRKGKSKKANLENDYDSEEMEDKDKKSKKPQKAKQDQLSGSDDDDHETQLKKSKGKNQKSNKKHDLSEDDETNVKKNKERARTMSTGESGDDSDDTSQTRKGQKKNQKPKSAPAAESGDEEEPSFKVKTVAQKKAEKKERERKKREEEKAKLRKQKEELEGGKEPAKPKEAAKKAEEKTSEVTVPSGPGEKGETPAGADADDNEGDKKKKDKKKKKGEKEEKEKEKEKKKGPSKATVKAMQEALAKMKEEEERARREEEERIRRLEELEAKRKEEERLEQERRERKKQKEKERKERLKKEGKLLTKAQREARARAEATLKLLQAQGVEVPSKDSVPKKRPIYEDKKKKKQQQPENKEGVVCQPVCFLAISENAEVTSPAEDAVELETPVKEETPLPVEPEEKEEEEVESDDGGLDDWEAMVSDEDGEKESKPVHIEVKEQNEVDEEEEEEEDEEEEDEESEESEDSEGSEDEDEKTSDEREADSQAIGKQSMEKKLSKEISSDSEYDSEDDRTKEERAYDKAKRRIEKRRAENSKNVNTEKLRAPVICVLGHVDTGKTKILDKLRHTHVQDSEAGGITQQIGATNVPLEAINEQTKMVKNFDRENIKIPGMLIIDTPGHESFSNLRNRGSSLCDIAILVVDIMHGLEPQTIESLNLLKSKKCPFIVALNKVRQLHTDVSVTLKKQKKNTKDEFEERAKAIIVEFAKQGLNAALYYENKDPRTFVSLVPTSAHTGDGMGSLIALLVELTQTMLTKRLAECQELRAQVMEVKALPGMGTTIDVILINGRLKEGDTIIVPGVEGPIVTQIRGLLLPPPMKELRVKNQYEKHKEVVAAQGVKILGKDLEKTLAGLPLLVAYKDDEVPVLKDELIHELKQTLNAIKLEEKGVYVQASTLGSLEALLEFLKTSEVPYSGINIGPVHKKDVMKASVMLEHDPQYAVILAFDVRIERDAQEMADSLGVRVFSAEIIYHLFDAFTKYRQDYKKQKQEEFKHVAVFPCKMKILPQFIFNSRDPIVMGVVVEAGQVKQGTPMCVPSKNFIDIGIVTSIEINHKPVEVAKKGQEVCVKIEPIPGESPKMYGRHFEATDILVSKISRQSIDALKDWFRDEMQKSDWQLIVELKKVFEII